MKTIEKRRKGGIREGNQFATFLMYAACVIIAFITVYPMYYVLILSLSAPEYASTMRVYTIPKGFDLSAYEVLVTDMKMWRAYANTVLYVVPTTILMILTSSLVAYGLNYRKLIGRKYLTMFLLIPMYFSGGTIPSFLLITKLGLYDSPLSQIIPACFSIWNIILVKAYFRSIPESLSEAAKIDGAGILQIFTKVIVPLGKPIFAVIAVYTIVGVWNSWFNALIYLNDQNRYPLQLLLRSYLFVLDNTQMQQRAGMAGSMNPLLQRQIDPKGVRMAMIVVTMFPIMAAYPYFQKYFMKGVMIGAVKG